MRRKLVGWAGTIVSVGTAVYNMIGLSGAPGDVVTWTQWWGAYWDRFTVADTLIVGTGLFLLVTAVFWDRISEAWGKWRHRRRFGPLDVDFTNLLAGSRPNNQEPHIAKFWVAGVNRSNRPVEIVSAEVQSFNTGEKQPLHIRTDKGYVPVSEANPIPPHTKFYLHHLLYDPESRKQPEGIPESEFLKHWGSFEIALSYNGKTRRQQFGKDLVRNDLLLPFRAAESTPMTTAKRLIDVQKSGADS